MRRLSLHRLQLLMAALLLFTGLTGCDSTVEAPGTPPAVPPTAAFTLQTDLFQQQAGSKAADGSFAHFANAALRVWPVSAVVGAHLIVPAVVTAAALEAEPVLEDGAWLWTAETEADQQDVRFTLIGRTGAETIDWSMRLAVLDPETGDVVDEFELYTAETDPDTQTGSWQLYYRLDGERRHVLDATYAVHADDEKEITFRVPDTAGEHAGAEVRYAEDGNLRSFFWLQAGEGHEHFVEWNATTHAGTITATNYNGGAPACWDAQLQDADCGS